MSRNKIPVSYSFAPDTLAVLRDVAAHYGISVSMLVERATRRELTAIMAGGRLLDPPGDMPVVAPACVVAAESAVSETAVDESVVLSDPEPVAHAEQAPDLAALVAPAEPISVRTPAEPIPEYLK